MTEPPDSQKNYLVVDAKTETSTIESTFDKFTKERKDIAILLINQHVCFTFPSPLCLHIQQLYETQQGYIAIRA